jgi:hypothetical protein
MAVNSKIQPHGPCTEARRVHGALTGTEECQMRFCRHIFPDHLRVQAEGGSLFEFEPIFLQLEILGESGGAKGAENYFFTLTRCVYTQTTQNFVENSKMGEKH